MLPWHPGALRDTLIISCCRDRRTLSRGTTARCHQKKAHTSTHTDTHTDTYTHTHRYTHTQNIVWLLERFLSRFGETYATTVNCKTHTDADDRVFLSPFARSSLSTTGQAGKYKVGVFRSYRILLGQLYQCTCNVKVVGVRG